VENDGHAYSFAMDACVMERKFWQRTGHAPLFAAIAERAIGVLHTDTTRSRAATRRRIVTDSIRTEPARSWQ
jgi:hypothetical protein